MGDSDSDSDDCFEGFTLREIVKGDESDIDLDVIVRDEQLTEHFGAEDGSDDHSESGDDKEADVVLPTVAGPSQPKKRQRMTKGQRNTVTTHFSDRTHKIDTKNTSTFDRMVAEGKEKVNVFHNLPADATRYDYFTLLFPETMWTDFAEQTNEYAKQKQQEKGDDKLWKETTATEMKLFIFIQYMFGIHRMPDTAMYWSTDPLLRVPAIADVMGKGRFQKLSQYFHINDNLKAAVKGQPGYDPLFKVRPLLDTITENSRKYYFPGRDISVDEAMIKFNGRLSFKQYIKGM